MTPAGTFGESYGGTDSLTGRRLAMRLPIMNYGEPAGVIEVDMRDSLLLKQIQDQVDQQRAGNPLKMKIAYSRIQWVAIADRAFPRPGRPLRAALMCSSNRRTC